MKRSNPPGHLAKVVILPAEVKYDDREKAAELQARDQEGCDEPDH